MRHMRDHSSPLPLFTSMLSRDLNQPSEIFEHDRCQSETHRLGHTQSSPSFQFNSGLPNHSNGPWQKMAIVWILSRRLATVGVEDQLDLPRCPIGARIETTTRHRRVRPDLVALQRRPRYSSTGRTENGGRPPK